MKRVISVSLGSSTRDHVAEAEMLGERIRIERKGTDGDFNAVLSLIRQYDGQVDAFGMGGIDLYLVANGKRYTLRDGRRIADAARVTPIVDGSGLKNTLERRVVKDFVDAHGPLEGKKVLMVSAVDRFGMAEAFVSAGCRMLFGDLIFALGIPIPIYSLRSLGRLAAVLLPVLSQMPFQLLYPTGKKQETVNPRYTRFYNESDIIAGDFLFIRKYMPERLDGKTIFTNTVTMNDIEEMRRRGVRMIITTTPELGGRSFGTNVMEAVLVALSGRMPDDLAPRDYDELLDRIGFKPRVVLF